jgi:hypothetical protein
VSFSYYNLLVFVAVTDFGSHRVGVDKQQLACQEKSANDPQNTHMLDPQARHIICESSKLIKLLARR